MSCSTVESLDVLRSQAEADYRKLVFSVAGGAPVDPAALQAVLWPLKRSVDDFAAHVETAKCRLDGRHLEVTADPQFAEQIASLESRRVECGEVVRVGKEAAKSIDFDLAKISRLRDMARAEVNTYPMSPPISLQQEAAAIEQSLDKPKAKVAAGEEADQERASIDAKIESLRLRQHDPLIGMNWEG